MFFNGLLDIGTPLHCGIVGNDHHLLAVDHPDPGDDPGGGKPVVVQSEGGQR